MPKGKAKKDNPDLYQGSPETQEPSMAPQAVAHRRGGKHRVKSADLTHSIYDDFSYAEVLELARERGIYRKDMKKKEMALANKQYDEDVHSRERAAVIEQQKRDVEKKRIQQQKDDEKQAAIRAKHQRAMQKEKQRAEGQEVSDDSLDEDDIDAEHERLIDGDEYKQENVGQMLSDESWDSTSTESTVQSANETLEPDCRLRLYEWPEWPHEEDTSSMDGKASPDSDPSSDPVSKEWRPVKVPYAPLKVFTTNSKQKLFLPGQAYPPGVQPNFVPVLSLHTRHAARNGVLIGVLRKAIIEPASDWAKRTQIQGETAIMFFSLPPRNEAKNLTETYDKWCMENRKLLRVQARGDGASANRAKRHAQRFRNKAKKVVEVYDASQYRPLAICYVPSYMDYNQKRLDDRPKSDDEYRGLDNLFFIRFPGSDVPHYYFWARLDEWSDPTTRNPDWEATTAQKMSSATVSSSRKGTDHRLACDHSCKKATTSPPETWTKIEIPNATLPAPPAAPGNFKTALIVVEHQLHATGLATTLSHYRKKWMASDKHHAWQEFSQLLPTLYPSGNLPLFPPSFTASHEHSLAFKIATIDTIDPDEPTPVNPLQGDESWTHDDDAYWKVAQADSKSPLACTEHDMQAQLERTTESDGEPVALYRRASIIPNFHVCANYHTDSGDVLTWLSQISPSFGPWPVLSIPSKPGFDEWEKEGGSKDWEEAQLRPVNRSETPCPFCNVDWVRMGAEKREQHLWSHSVRKPGYMQWKRSLPKQSPISAPPKRASGRLAPLHIRDYDVFADGDVDTPTAINIHTDKFLPRLRSYSTYVSSSSKLQATKRRKIADPAYRENPASENDKECQSFGLEHPVRKRSKMADLTYRDIEAVLSSSDEVVVSRLSSKRKRTKGTKKCNNPEDHVDACAAASEMLKMELKRPLKEADARGEERVSKRLKSVFLPSEEQRGCEWCIVM